MKGCYCGYQCAQLLDSACAICSVTILCVHSWKAPIFTFFRWKTFIFVLFENFYFSSNLNKQNVFIPFLINVRIEYINFLSRYKICTKYLSSHDLSSSFFFLIATMKHLNEICFLHLSYLVFELFKLSKISDNELSLSHNKHASYI